MTRHTPVKALVAAVFAPLVLAACAGAFEAQYPIVKQEPPTQSLTRFTDPALRDAKQFHVSYLGAFEYVDYGRYETPDLVLESVYDVATSINTVLQYDYWMSRMADTWNLNNGQPKSWGKEQTVRAWHGSIEYQPYRLTAAGRDCTAFSAEWGNQALDTRGRPTRVFFGYACARPGKPLDVSKAVALIASVRFSDQPVESLVPVNSRRSVDRSAFAAAQGVSGGSTGNAKFPFDFGTVYVEGDGAERSH